MSGHIHPAVAERYNDIMGDLDRRGMIIWGGQDEGESFIPLRAAECVCEEPCRYCRCKETE